jgi:protein-S-isoprenylcysteine O-methyltransferase Ste14
MHHRYRADMRSLAPWIIGFVVLVVLWPTVCASSEGGATTCQSAVLLPLPWGESADSWGMIVAIGAAAIAYFAVRYVLRRNRRRDP